MAFCVYSGAESKDTTCKTTGGRDSVNSKINGKQAGRRIEAFAFRKKQKMRPHRFRLPGPLRIEYFEDDVKAV